MDGVVVIDKPVGPTSMRVVERVKRALRERKAGHAGTLDPAASGLLPVCLGAATRLVPWLQDGDKEYLATVRLGLETDTCDMEGEVTARAEVPPVDEAGLAPHLAALTGRIMQSPPAYSALRSGGERLYDKARRGEVVVVPPRPVVVHSLALERLAPPDLVLRVVCGKGTYVRSLALDLGRSLGCGACLAALRRTRVGPFDLARAVPLERLEELAREGRAAEAVLPPVEAVRHLERATLTPSGVDRVRTGQPARPEDLAAAPDGLEPGAAVALLAPGGGLVAVAEASEAGLRPRRVMPAEAGDELHGD